MWFNPASVCGSAALRSDSVPYVSPSALHCYRSPVRLAIDEDWLHKATRDLAKYWKHKRERIGRKQGRRTAPIGADVIPGSANSRASLN